MNEELRIDAEHPITQADVERWAIWPDGVVRVVVREHRHPDEKGCLLCTADGREAWPPEDGATWSSLSPPTRWLSRDEFRERGLECTHPSQAGLGRAQPGEFRVGDRVRSVRECDNAKPGVTGIVRFVCSVRGGSIAVECDAPPHPDKHDCGGRTSPDRGWWFPPSALELIERAGDAGGDAEAAETPGAPSPAAPSEGERLAEFFRDKRPQPVPFELGRKVEPVVRREPCPCCARMTRESEPWAPGACPECDGRGWQEVK